MERIEMGNSGMIDKNDMYQYVLITHSLYQFKSECISVSVYLLQVYNSFNRRPFISVSRDACAMHTLQA